MNEPQNILETSVQYVKGVGPKFARVLNRLGIFSVNDLLYYFPRDYEDRRSLNKIRDINYEKKQMFLGTLEKVAFIKTRRFQTIIRGVLNDGTGQIVLVWFRQRFLAKILKKGQKLFVIGKPQYNPASREVQLVPQEYEIIPDGGEKQSLSLGRILPKYPLTENLSQKKMRRTVYEALRKYYPLTAEFLPENLIRELKLAPLNWCLKNLHFPANFVSLEKARRRLVFEEFFLIQLTIFRSRQNQRIEKGITFSVPGNLLRKYQDSLKFNLTSDQHKTIDEIFGDMVKPLPMRRILQGDVGSGKTAVAAAALLLAIENGYQVAFMAPTEILASQHLRTLAVYLKDFDIQPVLLTSGIKAAEKKKTITGIKNGTARLVIGTHAIIQPGVEFNNLGLVIIDEQHRFGVEQRLALMSRGQNPDLLVMTATPIPRTLMLTFYGDLDQSIIKEMPAGRLPVKTYFIKSAEKEKVYEFVRKQAAAGEQAFIVFPLVAQSEKLDLRAATESYQELKQGIFSGLEIALIHGRMKPEEKDRAMKSFSSGKINILISTTVIEVGVDVPAATIMIIEHAERFGLAVLHQLRGRIGRGTKQAHCFLIGAPPNSSARKRLKTMVATTDGFKISEVDLALRGPGEILGLNQSGFPEFKIADPVSDLKILWAAREAAQNLLAADPVLERPENQRLQSVFHRPGRNFIINPLDNN